MERNTITMNYYKDKNNEIVAFDDDVDKKINIHKYNQFIKGKGYTKLSGVKEAKEIVEASKTPEQKKKELENFIVSILETEMKDKKYFYGYGFKYGRSSVARYPNSPEAIKLTAWQEAVWQTVAGWLDEIDNGVKDISIFSHENIKANLPKVDDF